MKKIMIGMLVALGCAMGSFADTQYKVYNVKLTLVTSAAAGVTETSCGDQYFYRKKNPKRRIIKGVIAGCGCVAMAADNSCDNFKMYFWDESTKTELTNPSFNVDLLQRIGKNGEQVEQVVTLSFPDQEDEKFVLQLAGFGIYGISKTDANYDVMYVMGGVTGTKDAPYKTTPASCCGTGGGTDQTTAVPVCEAGTCNVSDAADTTPVYGTYKMGYSKKKSKACEKNGLSAKALGLPSYVTF